MTRFLNLPFVLAIAVACVPANGAEKPVDYERDVRPLVHARCVTCHGALRSQSALRLDTGLLMRKGGDSGAAVVPGEVAKSLLVERISSSDPELRMPPEGDPLTVAEIALLTRWVEEGAKSPDDEQPLRNPNDHWAFKKPNRPAVPDDTAFANPIDRFLVNKRKEHGLAAAPQALPGVLLRRASLDLTGLPPTPEQVEAFEKSPTEEAWRKVVDDLLASPHHGERWGRHWMDVWRYSDWYGYRAELRNSARHIWRWRDWIVESSNEDKPYNQMILEMLAGDELAPTDPDTVRATGFLARSYFKFNRDTWLNATIEHTSKAFLGLTINCARCHDHMYDPISQKDFYRFRAIFEPYQVRTDRMAGRIGVTKNAVALAYDALLKKPTYLYLRGNDKRPDKDNPLDAALPEFFSTELAATTIELPPEAWYPGLREHLQQESLADAEAQLMAKQLDLQKAQQAHDSAKSVLAKSAAPQEPSAQPEPAQADPKTSLEIATLTLKATQLELEAAQANLEFQRARIEADRAKFGSTPGADPESLAGLAAKLSQAHAIRVATALVKRREVQSREAALKPAAERAKANAAAKKNLTAAQKQLADAEKSVQAETTTYPLLTATYPKTSTGRRLALARWIASEKNPLTARVAVNHVWLRHFGEPLVASVFDFGMNGSQPTHPELLDWLAVELMEHDWSLKHLHRLILTSAAWRMQSSSQQADEAVAAALARSAKADPENKWLWRANPRRMESEIVRDSVLAVSGQLDPTRGGPELDQNLGLTSTRRSIYYRHAPEKQVTFLALFDTASTDECYRRNETIVPQQALALVNSQLAIEQSRHLTTLLHAKHKLPAKPESDSQFVEAAFHRILCRPPTAAELAECRSFLVSQTAKFQSVEKLTAFSQGPKLRVGPSSDPLIRSRENLAHVLLNHNDFVTVR